jgi:hypothetical protein
MKPADRKKGNRRAVFFAGKQLRVVRINWSDWVPDHQLCVDYIAKLTIRLIVENARVINADPDT